MTYSIATTRIASAGNRQSTPSLAVGTGSPEWPASRTWAPFGAPTTAKWGRTAPCCRRRLSDRESRESKEVNERLLLLVRPEARALPRKLSKASAKSVWRLVDEAVCRFVLEASACCSRRFSMILASGRRSSHGRSTGRQCLQSLKTSLQLSYCFRLLLQPPMLLLQLV